MSTLESSIADHLQCPRSLPARLPSPSFQPPYPSFSVRFPQAVSQLVIAIIGSQHKASSAPEAISASRATISSFLASPNSSIPPTFVEWASVTDNRGCYNLCALAYWDSKSSYESWASSSGFQTWWESLDADSEDDEDGPGWFLEVLSPSMDRFETLFNTDSASEGSSHVAGSCMSSAVQEHGYWGSMRDRIPLSQTNALSCPSSLPSPPERQSVDQTTTGSNKNERITIPGRKNLAIIRSGQDWSTTTPEERQLYLESMHPVLRKGMDFLRDHGKDEVGCYSCRFMEVLDLDETKSDETDKTFGLAYFDELASLERWSKEHPTHLAIFGGFFQYAKQLGNNVTLRVFHEVMVLDQGQQFFEYVGCHDGTGMLAARDESEGQETT